MRRATVVSALSSSSSARRFLLGAAVRTASASSSSRPIIASVGPSSTVVGVLLRRRERRIPFPSPLLLFGAPRPPPSATFSASSSDRAGGVGGTGGIGDSVFPSSARPGEPPPAGGGGPTTTTPKSDRGGGDRPGGGVVVVGGGPRGLRRSFGPRGHDYRLDPAAGPKTSVLSDDDIHSLLSRRLEARLARKFGFADILQNELRWFGVDVDDKRKLWRADGSRFGRDESSLVHRVAGPKEEADDDGGVRGDDESQRRGVGGDDRRGGGLYGPLGHDYRLPPDAGPKTSILPDERIHELLSRRLQARLTGKFSVADVLRDELRWFGVDFDDARRMWRADGKRFGRESGANAGEDGGRTGGATGNFDGRRVDHAGQHDYELYDRAGPKTSALSTGRIRSLLSGRMQARRMGNYDAADEIRKELHWYGVDVDDKRRVWRADGSRFVEDDLYWRELPKRGDDEGRERGQESATDKSSSS